MDGNAPDAWGSYAHRYERARHGEHRDQDGRERPPVFGGPNPGKLLQPRNDGGPGSKRPRNKAILDGVRPRVRAYAAGKHVTRRLAGYESRSTKHRAPPLFELRSSQSCQRTVDMGSIPRGRRRQAFVACAGLASSNKTSLVVGEMRVDLNPGPISAGWGRLAATCTW